MLKPIAENLAYRARLAHERPGITPIAPIWIDVDAGTLINEVRALRP